MKFAIVDSSRQFILDQTFENLDARDRDRVTARMENKWGILDIATGTWAVEPQYDELRFGDSVLRGQRGDGWGLLDLAGHEFGSWDFEHISFFSEGLAAARDAVGRYGFINSSAKWIVEPRFRHADPFREGFCVASVGVRQYGHVDRQGAPLRGFGYVEARLFGEGLAFVQNEQAKGFIDASGELVLNGEWLEDASVFREGFCRYRTREDAEVPGVGFLDLHGRPTFDRVFERAGYFREGFSPVRIQKKWGAIDTQGNVVVPPEYDELGQCSHGLMAAHKDGRCGYITPDNQIAIPFEFAAGRAFTGDGIAVVGVSDG